MNTKDLVQGSTEWLEARSQRLTASVFGSAMGINKYQSRQKLWAELVGEAEPFTGNAMTEYGIENEPNAIFEYESWSGEFVEPSGFWTKDDWLGCSPDGLVGDMGLIECKCRFDQVPHIAIPDYYMAQMQGQMWIIDRDWCDFVSWTPDETNIWRVERSQEYIESMEALLADFWAYVVTKEKPKRQSRPDLPDVKIERLR